MSTITIPSSEPFSNVLLGHPDQNGACADDKEFEIVNGERVEVPPMSVLASWFNNRLNVRLSNFVDAQKLGRVVVETMLILDAAEKFQRKPDLAFVSNTTWPLHRPLPEEGDWQVVPDLTVEVVSPNDVFEAVLVKIIAYFGFGVKCVWLVSPKSKKVFVFESQHKVTMLGVGDELDGGKVVPGFRVKLCDVFETSVAN